jgi:quercetin dioxygenase-like cupin family protein
MFAKHDGRAYVTALAGVERRTPVHGDKTLLSEFRLTAGHTIPRHAHVHEQTGYLLSGRMRLSIGTDTHDVRPGDSWCVPGNVEHGVEIVEDCVAIEVFSPVREDYLP